MSVIAKRDEGRGKGTNKAIIAAADWTLATYDDMNRIPPCLLYLAIYNPTLSPIRESGDEIDEDAEEQAHILFYTSKERAVSRDRMLRQIGLAKALVNFNESV